MIFTRLDFGLLFSSEMVLLITRNDKCLFLSLRHKEVFVTEVSSMGRRFQKWGAIRDFHSSWWPPDGQNRLRLKLFAFSSAIRNFHSSWWPPDGQNRLRLKLFAFSSVSHLRLNRGGFGFRIRAFEFILR